MTQRLGRNSNARPKTTASHGIKKNLRSSTCSRTAHDKAISVATKPYEHIPFSNDKSKNVNSASSKILTDTKKCVEWSLFCATSKKHLLMFLFTQRIVR